MSRLVQSDREHRESSPLMINVLSIKKQAWITGEGYLSNHKLIVGVWEALIRPCRSMKGTPNGSKGVDGSSFVVFRY